MSECSAPRCSNAPRLPWLTERQPEEDKRRLILAAAVRVFAEKGYHDARVVDIAEEAGVAYGILYHYFGSKDEVLNDLCPGRPGA